MAWTPPKTYTSGSALTSAELNSYQRDNQTWLKNALATHGITSDSVIGRVKTKYVGVGAYRDTTQTMASGAWWPVQLTTGYFVTQNPAGMHSTSVNPSRITIPVTGLWHVGYELQTNFSGALVDNNVRAQLTHGAGYTYIPGSRSFASYDITYPQIYNHGATYWSATAGDWMELMGAVYASIDSTSAAYVWAFLVAEG